MATLIPANGPTREDTPANGRTYTLAELQAIVGGYIEALRAPDGRLMFVNEDGKRMHLPRNSAATVLMRPRLLFGDCIVGDAVLCTPLEAGEEPEEDGPLSTGGWDDPELKREIEGGER